MSGVLIKSSFSYRLFILKLPIKIILYIIYLTKLKLEPCLRETDDTALQPVWLSGDVFNTYIRTSIVNALTNRFYCSLTLLSNCRKVLYLHG